MLTSIKLTVFFENPFWVGIFEIEEGDYEVSKITFGAEPKDFDIYQFILKRYYKLNFFKEELDDKKSVKNSINPKRLQREIKKALNNKEVGTKAQIALKKQYEENKIEHKKNNKKNRELKEIRKYEIKKKKRKEKHRGH